MHEQGTVAARFWAKVDKNGPLPPERPDLGVCWVWTASLKPNGYGQFGLSKERRSAYAHRVSYEMAHGAIPEGMHLDHLCRNPACVNPAHLEVVTCLENLRRGVGYGGRSYTHCKHGHEFTEANTWYRPDRSGRVCRICRDASVVRWRARHAGS